MLVEQTMVRQMLVQYWFMQLYEIQQGNFSEDKFFKIFSINYKKNISDNHQISSQLWK